MGGNDDDSLCLTHYYHFQISYSEPSIPLFMRVIPGFANVG